ncbi:MAG: response regulator [Acidimicrobiia bacterium]
MGTIAKVLLVDDDPDIRMLGQLCLQRVGGWDVTAVASGDEAIVAAAQDLPDLIVLDMMMPGRDGLSTLGALRRQPATAQIPVVFMTAKVQRAEVEAYLACGAQGVVTKPFDPMTLPAELTALTAPDTDLH